jgi:TetR/AcrR family transcriptional repressor of nem operon
MPRPKEFDEDKALIAAMELFWQRGYTAASLADLTASMGISRQSLYDTYGDKHGLFLKALDRYCALVGEQLLGPLCGQDPGLAEVEQTVVAFIDFLVAYPTPRACLMANSAMEIAPHDQTVAEKVQAFHRTLEQAFARALAIARDRGEIGEQLDPALLARFLVTAANGLAVAAKTGVGKGELLAIAGIALCSLQPAPTVSTAEG